MIIKKKKIYFPLAKGSTSGSGTSGQWDGSGEMAWIPIYCPLWGRPREEELGDRHWVGPVRFMPEEGPLPRWITRCEVKGSAHRQMARI